MDLSQLTSSVCEIARSVGTFIRNEQISAEAVEEKSKNSLVTYVDKTAEKRIIEGLEQLLPEAGFIAEEGTSDKKGERYNWIIDPLDGTTNFIHRIPCFSVSIALTDGDDLLLGVVYEVNLDECFYAWKDGGAYLNGSPISVSPTVKLSDSLLATGFPYYNYDRQEEYMELFKDLMKKSRGLRRLGSAAVDLVYVACGRFDGFYEYSLNPWDVAGGSIIVTEAGGRVADFSRGNNFLFGEEIVATNASVYEEFATLVESHFTS